ncbi:MAG: hypothetical protein IMZ70_06060 [Candidatus Atribacteria bacterium]|nr:hypothetical protein [Candidatus Atribacteria bacterium]
MATLKEYFNPSDASDYDAGSLTSKSQSFVAESSYTVSQVILKLKMLSGSPHHLYGVYLYNTDVNGLPTGAALVQFGSFYVDELSTSYADYSFSNDTIAITATNEYAIAVLTAEEVTTSNVFWYTSATAQYTTGTAGKHNYIGGWSVLGSEHDRWFECYEAGGGVPTKATIPVPTNAATGVDWSAKGLGWTDGGGADTYNVYFGLSGVLSLISYAQVGTSITVDAADIPYPEEGESGAVFYWRIDSTNDEGTTTGDQWTFDARPAKATVPSPTNAATGTVLGLTTTWTGGATATTYNILVDVGAGLVSQETALEDATWTPAPTVFDYITAYTWRVDSVNAFGITEGDEWTFTTIRLSPPGVTYWYTTTNTYYRLLVQSDGTYGDPPPTGTVDVDYVVLAYEPNFIRTNRVLAAVAENRFWYEDIT